MSYTEAMKSENYKNCGTKTASLWQNPEYREKMKKAQAHWRVNLYTSRF